MIPGRGIAGPPPRARKRPEAELQAAIVETAKLLGWSVYHTFDSRRSEAGFPDLVLVRARGRRLLFRELKSEDGSLSPEQSAWLTALEIAGADVGVWRPADWSSGRIEAELR